MAYDLEEQEQIEQLKAWWNKYGTITLLLLTLALAVVLGWQGWNWYQNHQAVQARGYFEALQKAAQQNEGEESVVRVNAALKTLQQDYGSTDYAARATLVAAQALLRDQNVEGAKAALQWLANSDHPALVPVAKLRLADLWLDQKDFDQAMAQLKSPPASFEGLFADRRGDILMAKGQKQEAVQQWRQAIEQLGSNPQLRDFVELKVETSGG
ncbi:YfgM family protein [Orrella sp. 11846]|uniref:YfgM family protein n=1 Tax=Orrella sp. 11846 TaxID=3409913 RepID=UPI003B5CC9BD